LLNVSSATVDLYDPAHPTNAWRLQGGVEFVFPPNSSIAPGEYIIVTSFGAGDGSQPANFRAKYNVPGGVALYGPYQGKLSNGGDTVELARPDAPQAPPSPDAGFVPYILVDRVVYSDSSPWPSGADGATNGSPISLQRIVPTHYGNEPLNWVAGAATAGVTNGPSYLALPSITQQPQDRGGLAGVTLSFSVTASGPGPLQLLQAGRDQLLKGGNAAARSAFNELITKYPKSEYVPEAMFYTAQAYAAERNLTAADAEYSSLIAKYPKSPRVPTAMYKRALQLQAAKKNSEAKKLYQDIIKRFPRSDEAALADERLQSMR